MRKSIYIIGVILLLASCGQQHQAKGVIQDFVNQYVSKPSSLSSISIVKFDSTRVLSDSVIARIRANADTIKRYSAPVKYSDRPMGRKLYVARISYAINGTEYCDTYYLDEQISHVVAFKSN